MNDVVAIGQPPWSRADMIEKLEEFAFLYEHKPIRDKHNQSGMKSPHMFLAWFVLQWFQPEAIVESGVYRGQGTWFFEQACPNAKLYCIDTHPCLIWYRSERATYFDRDFSLLNWDNLPRDSTVLFFDDHYDDFGRVELAHRLGFKHLLLEDNYPMIEELRTLKGIFASPEHVEEREYLLRHLKVYCELPPVFRGEKNYRGDDWGKYPTPEPLLTRIEEDYQQVYLNEATRYAWMAYVNL